MTAFRPGLLLASFISGLFLLASCKQDEDERPFFLNADALNRLNDTARKGGLTYAQAYLDSVYRKQSPLSITNKMVYYKARATLLIASPLYSTAAQLTLPLLYLDTMESLLNKDKQDKDTRRVYRETLLDVSNYFVANGQYEKAKGVIAKAWLFGQEGSDTCYMSVIAQLFGSVFLKQADYQRAASFTLESLSLLESCREGYYYRKQRLLDDLGFVYRSSRVNLDSAIYYHRQAAAFVEENKAVYNDSVFVAQALQNIYSNLAITYRMNSQFPSSVEFFLKSLKTGAPLKDSAVDGQILTHLALGYFGNDRLDTVLILLKSIDPYLAKLDAYTKYDYYNLRSKVAEKLNKKEEEIYYLKKRIVVLDSALKDVRASRMNDPQIEYEKLDKKYQTELLQRDNHIQRNKVTAVIIIGSILFIGIIFSGFLLSKLRKLIAKKDQLNHALEHALDERERIETELRDKELFAQEMELNMEFQVAILEQRRQISDDMHDELSSSLAALKFYVTDLHNQATGTDTEPILSDIVAEVSTVYESARHYMHSLKSNDWQTRFSLIGFLQDIRQKFQQKKLMIVTLDLDEEGIQHQLSTYQLDQLYHIIKECLTNIIRHANAGSIHIRIAFDNNFCRFTVVDDGKGFDAGSVTYGIGIGSMNARMGKINGTIDIGSNNPGTIVQGHFPVN